MELIILGCGTSYHAGLWGSYEFKSMRTFNSIQVIDGAEFDEIDLPLSGKSVSSDGLTYNSCGVIGLV